MAKILLVEDDHSLGMVIEDNLQVAGHSVELRRDGMSAWHTFSESDFDICLLDVMMPLLDGFSLAHKIRNEDKAIPIIFITAKAMEEDRLQGFEKGGDDYITKPFNMKELLYRIDVFLRRNKTSKKSPSNYQLGRYEFDFNNLQLSHALGHISLTPKEASVLKCLCDNFGKVVKRQYMLKEVWGDDDYFLGRSMDVFISKLRKHLKDEPSLYIENHHGVGFKICRRH